MSKPAKASDYLYHLTDYYKQHPDIIVILYSRVSSGAQKYNCNHDSYKRVLRKVHIKRNIPMIDYFEETTSGWNMDYKKRKALIAAVELAKQLIAKGKHVIILAPSADRFLRNINFNTITNPDILPTIADFEQFRELT